MAGNENIIRLSAGIKKTGSLPVHPTHNKTMQHNIHAKTNAQ